MTKVEELAVELAESIEFLGKLGPPVRLSEANCTPRKLAGEILALARPQTKGEVLAERMVRVGKWDRQIRVNHPTRECYIYVTPSAELPTDVCVKALREYLAAAFDKAIADDRAAMDDIIAEAVRADRERWATAFRDWTGTDDGDLRLDPEYVASCVRACESGAENSHKGAVANAVKAEREACAKVAESHVGFLGDQYMVTAGAIARKIRERHP